jgi:hypothetical protein
MGGKICFVSNEVESFSEAQKSNSEIFTFDYKSDLKLKKLGIEHRNAEEYLTKEERLWIFDIVKEFRDWHTDSSLDDFKLNGTNVLGLLDGIEFHTLLMEKLIGFWTIKKIVESKNPSFIECPYDMVKMIQILDEKNQIEIKLNSEQKENQLSWDSINVKHNVGNIPISMKISRNKYNKLKNILDKSISSTFGLWFNFKNRNKKTILLLEIYPPVYKELFQNLKNKNFNIIIINRRRPVTLERNSIKILKNNNCKLISKDDLFEKEDKNTINEKKEIFRKKIDDIFSYEKEFESIFKINDLIFWPIIKYELKNVFKRRIDEYVELIIFAEKIFEKINVVNILSLYESGETERAFLNQKSEKINSYLLEHGFTLLSSETKRFGMLSSYDKFTDKIMVWSNYQKDFLISNFNINSEKIIPVGSPRHDIFTKLKKSTRKNNEISILIAPTPITQIQGFDTTEIHRRFESTIKELCTKLKNQDIKLIFKIHPSQSTHNDEIKEIIKKYQENPIIYFLKPIIDLVNMCDLIITITPQGWAGSTIILESMILGKPAINIVLDDKKSNFEYLEKNAAISISYNDIDNQISKLINDVEYRNEICENALKFSGEFLCNYGNSSEKLADILTKN